MRICLVYDCLFPWTIGGAERWYRALAERLAAEGHELAYLTLRQWDETAPPVIPGVRVVAVGPRLDLYRERGGRRRIWPPVRFGAGVGWHLLRHRGQYDVVHIASFPFFSLIAAALARRWGGYRLVVDWWEVWSRAYWREYLGAIGGTVGWGVQRLCARLSHDAFCFSQLHAERLRTEDKGATPVVLRGVYTGLGEPVAPRPAEPIVLFAGRHISEKRVATLPPAILEARKHLPSLRGLLMGDGPERATVARLVVEAGLSDVIELPGFVDDMVLAAAMHRALCLILPSSREGFGLVVIEAAAKGLPSVVVRAPDNAATELIEAGVNGIISPSASAAELASAILRVHEAGFELRSSTAAWFAANVDRFSMASSLTAVLDAYCSFPAGSTRSDTVVAPHNQHRRPAG